MSEFIEREALLAEYDRAHQGPPGGARKLILEAPAADVEKVIRCKDCRFWDKVRNPKHEGVGVCKPGGYCVRRGATKENDYCSQAERRTHK